MNIETNLRGRLRNTSLPKSRGLLPLFESLINSIHGLEEAEISTEQGLICIVIERAPNLFDGTAGVVHGRPASGHIVGFRVIDNGVGFNEANFNSFRTLDTEYKTTKGGRGIGRLLWLKAFNRVDISSYFLDARGQLKRRSFNFSPDGITNNTVKDAGNGARLETVVHLVGFDNGYRTYTLKTGSAIAKAIVEHCLWYFVRPGGAPKIIVQDQREEISLDEQFEDLMHSFRGP